MRRADQMTVAHLLEFLHERKHVVDLYTLETGAEMSPDDRAWVSARTRRLFLYPRRRVRAALALLSGVSRGLPLQVALFNSRTMRRDLKREILANQYDLVYVYYFRSAEVVRGLGRDLPSGSPGSSTATYIALQLSQTLNTRRISENAPNLAYRALYALESRLVARYETMIWREFTHSILIGKSDLATINEVAHDLGRPPVTNSFFSAHGTDIARFKPSLEPTIPHSIVFSGVMRTPTNVQAVQWFVREVFPLVREQIPDATFTIVGREPSTEVRALEAEPGVEVTGTVPDPAGYIARAEVCVNPMQAGGGMQNKLIEFLASGKPTVATSVANEGISAPDSAIAIADEPQAFAEQVVQLLSDTDQATQLGQAARKFVEDHWTWEAHFLDLERKLIERTLDPRDVGC
ncbi:glycosyltransferase [Nocardioides hankookensis]